MSLSIIIATKNREYQLFSCIESIKMQTYQPDELIIVDDGNLCMERVKDAIPEAIIFKYYKKDTPGLSESRNIGARLASSEFILFLDDDTILEPNYIAKIMDVFLVDKSREFGGVSGVIVNRRKKPYLLNLWRMFFLHSLGRQGAILPWGIYTTVNANNTGVIQTDWVPGGYSCFRRVFFDDFTLYDFREYGNDGRHGLADVELCLRAGHKYKFAVTPLARLYHYPPPVGKERAYSSGYKQVFNHCVIFHKHCKKNMFNILAFSWAMTGMIIGNLLAALVVRKREERIEHLYKGMGNIRGARAYIFHKVKYGRIKNA